MRGPKFHCACHAFGREPNALPEFSKYLRIKGLAPRGGFEPPTFRLTAELVEILNALSCVAYRETRPIFSPSVGLLGLPAIDSVTPATKLDWEIGVGPKTRTLAPK